MYEMNNIVLEMNNHLQNILNYLNADKNNETKNNIRTQVKILKEQMNEIKNIDYKLVKLISDNIYLLNLTNDFSEEIELISNEYYAFQFLLEKLIKGGMN